MDRDLTNFLVFYRVSYLRRASLCQIQHYLDCSTSTLLIFDCNYQIFRVSVLQRLYYDRYSCCCVIKMPSFRYLYVVYLLPFHALKAILCKVYYRGHPYCSIFYPYDFLGFFFTHKDPLALLDQLGLLQSTVHNCLILIRILVY